MPQDLTDDATVWVAQSAPLAGEARTVQSVVDPLQKSANRVAYVRRRLNVLDPDETGVRRLKSVVDLDALAALTSHNDGDVVFVKGFGLYSYDAASVLTTNVPITVRPNDVDPGTGSGRWRFGLTSMYGTANGFPRLAASGKLASTILDIADATTGRILAANVKNGLVYYAAYDTPTSQSITNSSFGDVDNSVVSVPGMKSGDIMTVRYEFQCGTSSEGTDLIVQGSQGGGTDTNRSGSTYRTQYANAPTTMTGTMLATADGTMTMHLWARKHVAGTVCLINTLSIEAKVIRP